MHKHQQNDLLILGKMGVFANTKTESFFIIQKYYLSNFQRKLCYESFTKKIFCTTFAFTKSIDFFINIYRDIIFY